MDETLTTTETAPSTGLSRRTLIKGAAWAVPAVIVLGATPAYASSPPSSPVISSISLSGTRGTTNTKKDVRFTWTFSSSASISGVSVSHGGDTADFKIAAMALNPASGTSFTVTFTGSNSSSNTTQVPSFTLTVSYTGGSKTFTVGANSVGEGKTETFSVS